jgi:hypothetical protein
MTDDTIVEPSSGPRRGRLDGMLRAIGGCLPWRLLFLLALAALVLHLFGVVRLPFAPFTTLGEIYVDSPEVYTRERLVNDRYDQDYWLREQLRQLDAAESGDLVTGRLSREFALRAGAGDETDGAADPVRAAPAGLTFEQRFEVLAGIRDRIRQQVLENMLDDRHDLTGNSVYGLKFDTTVIPGRNTRDRAFVNVTLRPDALFVPATPPAGGAADDPDGIPPLPEYLRVFARRACVAGATITEHCRSTVTAAAQRRYDKQLTYYDDWRTDIAKRLNLTEDSLFESMYAGMSGCPAADADDAESRAQGQHFYDAVTRRTLRAVLGIPEERFTIYNEVEAGAEGDGETGVDFADDLDESRPIRLPPPWSRYLQISRRPVFLGGDRPCHYRVWFEVQPVFETFAARHIDPAGPAPDATDAKLIPVGETKHGNWQLLVKPWLFRLRGQQLISPAPLYTPPAALIELLHAQARLRAEAQDAVPRAGADPGPDEAGADGVVELPPMPSGFFNFVDSMAELDAYAYAIFPKNDLLGREVSSGFRAGGGSDGGMLAFAERLAETRTVPRLVGYGNGKPVADAEDTARTVRFGWVVSADGDMQPSLKTQLALVSVPAWTDFLHLSITTGWLNGAGKVRSQSASFDMAVTVPPDFSAFDSIFRDDAWVTRGPRVQDDSMEQSIYVIAGQPTRILIPGTRLWRSATVTLGAQRADRIRVLPNMEGIVAEFRAVDLPYAQPDATGGVRDCQLESPQLAEMRARPVKLRVWTSEGVDDAEHSVCVIYDPQAQIQAPVRVAAERAAAAEQAAEDQVPAGASATARSPGQSPPVAPQAAPAD